MIVERFVVVVIDVWGNNSTQKLGYTHLKEVKASERWYTERALSHFTYRHMIGMGEVVKRIVFIHGCDSSNF